MEDKELQAIRDCLNGEKQAEVVAKYGLNKGAFSSVMKGARLAEQLFKPSETPAVMSESLNPVSGLNCDACEQVHTLRAEVQTLQESLNSAPVSFDDAPAEDTGDSMEVQTLTDRVQELEGLNSQFQSENEGLRVQLSAMTEEITALKASAPAPDPAGGSGEGERTPGVYSYAQLKALEMDMQTVIDGKDSVIEHLTHDLGRMKKAYVMLRQTVQPGWEVGMPTTLQGVQKEDMERRFDEMEKTILSTSPEELEDAVRRMQADGHYPAGFRVGYTTADREELTRAVEKTSRNVREYVTGKKLPEFDDSPMTLSEVLEEKRKEKTKAAPEPGPAGSGLTTMNAEALKMVQTHGRTVQAEPWAPSWMPSPIVKVADRIFDKLGVN